MPHGLGLTSALLVAGGFSLGVYMSNLHNGLIAAAFTAVGVFVVRRRPGNREGWLFIATGVAHAVMFFGRQYGLYAGPYEGDTLPAVSWVTWMGVWPLALVLVLTGVTMMSFPDGRLPSPRWRVVVTAMVAAGALFALASALWPIEYADNSLSVPHPLHVGGYTTAQMLWDLLAPPVYLSFQIAWVAGVVVRLRRAEGDEAHQLKWFVYAVSTGAVAMALGFVLFSSPALGALAVPVVPVTAGVAIVKYRLYDIDVVINKTLVFGLLAGFITAVYVGIVVGVGGLVGSGGEPNPGLSITATAVVAVAFGPVRQRVQRLANRLVYGVRATPYEVLSAFSARMGETVQSDELLGRMARLLAQGTGAAVARVWLRVGAQVRPAAAWPDSHDQPAPQALTDSHILPVLPDADAVTPVVHHGDLLGALTVTKARGETLTPTDEALIGDLAAQAGLVLRNVRLTAELLDRLGELRASRQRLVQAQDAERRRLERDLHDGAQQQLVALKVKLGLARTMAEREDATKAAQVLGQLPGDADDAIATLRDLARGIYPPLLADQGLAVALQAQASKAPLPVAVHADDLGRYSQDTEAAVYFCCLEALQNTAKYADASHATITLTQHDGALVFTVADDGKGFDPDTTPPGSGLQNMADRLDAHSGSLTIDSTLGAGTKITGRLPAPARIPQPTA